MQLGVMPVLVLVMVAVMVAVLVMVAVMVQQQRRSRRRRPKLQLLPRMITSKCLFPRGRWVFRSSK
jgi:hypothetical protein